MSILRVLTIDDEVLALRRLKLLLQTIAQVDHVGEANSCREAISKIDSLKPDAVLLDIKMRDGSGFDVVEAIGQRPDGPAVIFVTAFDEFAVQAFDSAVADYLLKPVERDRLTRALDRVHRRHKLLDAEQRVDELHQIVRALRAARQGDHAYESEFWLKSSGGLVRVPVDTIESVSSEDEYIAIHTPSGSHLMRGSIRQFSERVEPGLFVRIHRRWLVKQTAIAELRTRALSSAEIILRSGQRLPAGRVYLKELRRTVQGATKQNGTRV
jgi:two-component system LytT family response regulator